MVGILMKMTDNFKKISDKLFVTTTKEGNCFAITTRCRNRPFHKKQDNYIITRERESFMLNSNEARLVLTPDRENKRQNGRRMKEDGEPMFTLTAQDKHGVYDGYHIRRLTPIECERLQGFPDNWTQYGKDDELISDTQRYKCCGNAVTTTVITAIVDEMFDEVG